MIRRLSAGLGGALHGALGRRLVILLVYAWLFLVIALPLLIVFKISLASPQLGRPPYTPLTQWLDGGQWQLTLNLGNYAFWTADPLYIHAYLNSVLTALVSTLFCLLLGYPMAYAIARTHGPWRTRLLMMVIVPFWTSFLIRIYAWIGILKPDGVINTLLLHLGLISQPLQLLYTPFSVYLGMTYGYLPFMILPLYACLEKLDISLLEAAADLGAKPVWTFLRVTIPLSWPGILAGSLLVFIPACGEYVIPTLLGGPNTLMIGTQIADEFFQNRDWPLAGAVAVTLLVLLLAPMIWFERLQLRGSGQR